MRVVRIQVFASRRFRSESGFFDRFTISLEAEIESSDSEHDAIRRLQNQADEALDDWVVEHEVKAVSPEPVAPPDPDEIQF